MHYSWFRNTYKMIYIIDLKTTKFKFKYLMSMFGYLNSV